MPKPVWGHVVGQPGRAGVAGEHGAHPTGAVGLLPTGLEQVVAAGLAARVDVQGEGLGEGGRERDGPVLAALAVGDADATGVEVDLDEADRDQLGDPDPGVESSVLISTTGGSQGEVPRTGELGGLAPRCAR